MNPGADPAVAPMPQDLKASELKRSGVLGWLALVAFVVRNWFVNWTFFLPSLILNLAGIFTSAAVYYLMGETVARGAASHLQPYDLSYGSFIVTGLIFNQVMQASLSAYAQSCQKAYWTMQFDVYLQHPGGVSALLTGEVLANYFLTVFQTTIYLVVGRWLFDVRIIAHNLPDVIVILALAILALTGLGLLGASTFTLLDAKAEGPDPVSLLIGFAATLLAGIYFPVSVLPDWLQRIGNWLPQTHALNAARLCLTGQASLGDPAVLQEVLFLLRFAAVSLPIGMLLFGLGMRKAQREGSLTRWN